MKKFALLIFLICFLLFLPVNGQPEQGKLFLGVASTFNMNMNNSDLFNMSFTTYKSSWAGETGESQKRFNINIIPRAGVFVTKNIAAGLDVYLSNSSVEDSGSGDKEIVSEIIASPFVRYYKFFPWGYPFAELNAGLGIQKNKYKAGPTSSGGDNVGTYGITLLGGGLGLAIPVGERAAFDIMAGYNRNRYLNKDTDYAVKNGAFLLKAGFIIFFLNPEQN